jgi:transducin (beta)-like 1
MSIGNAVSSSIPKDVIILVSIYSGGYQGRDVFASCSTDRTIAVCALSSDMEFVSDSPTTTTTPLQVLVGHADEVNAIRWDPSGTLLASCSDDHNVFVWQLGQLVTSLLFTTICTYKTPMFTRSSPVYRFSDHTEEIYTIRWTPTGPSTSIPNVS